MGDREIRLFGVAPESFVDGPGVRYVVFTQGCPHHCPGCHNPRSQAFSEGAGKAVGYDEILDGIDANSLISGVTLSGGEPFAQPGACAGLIRELKARRPEMDVWAWSGYRFEDLVADDDKRALLDVCDVLVDGPFIEGEKSMSCLWRGSRNQRVIDLEKSREGGYSDPVMHQDN